MGIKLDPECLNYLAPENRGTMHRGAVNQRSQKISHIFCMDSTQHDEPKEYFNRLDYWPRGGSE